MGEEKARSLWHPDNEEEQEQEGERMWRSESIDKLASALSRAQAVMQSAIKDSDNPFFKSRYADLSAVWEAARKPLTDNELAVAQITDMAEGNMVVVETILMHSSGQWIKSVLRMPYGKPDPQAVGSAITYARRYGLAAIIGVVADEDDDANKAAGNVLQELTEEPAKAHETPPKKTNKTLHGGNGYRNQPEQDSGKASQAQAAAIHAILGRRGLATDEERYKYVGELLGIEPPVSMYALTKAQASKVINALQKVK